LKIKGEREESKRSGTKDKEIGEGREGNGELKERVRKEMWERRERKERRRNVVIKGYKTEGGEVKSKIKEILKRMGVKVGVKEVRKVRTGREEQGGL